jgi:hypothetical protein
MAERLQYSMRALLLAVVMLSLPVAVLTREPTALSAAAAIILAMIIPAMTCSAACATDGYKRSCFISASIPAIIAALYAMFSLLTLQWSSYASFDEAASDIPFTVVFTVLWGSVPLAGANGIAARYLVFDRDAEQ